MGHGYGSAPKAGNSFLIANCGLSAGSAGVSPAPEAAEKLHLCTAERSHRCACVNHHTSTPRRFVAPWLVTLNGSEHDGQLV